MTRARAILWTSPDQAATLGEALRGADIELIGAGCPDPARTGQVASDLSTAPVDDLRQALMSTDTDMVLLGDAGAFGEQAHDADLDALRAAHARDVCVATLDPIPATASGIAGTGYAEALQQGSMASAASFVPLIRYRPIVAELSAVLETFAPVRSAMLRYAGPASLGSLGARLFNMLDLTRWLIGVPSVIEAAYVSPKAGRGLHPLPGETLRGLHGEITMNLRFPDGRCAAVYLCDQAHDCALSVHLTGAEGHIDLTQHGFAWTGNDGQRVDAHEPADASLNTDAGALRSGLAELCSGVAPSRSPIDSTGVLTMAHAALLSTRTGQGESPHDVEHLMLSM